MCAALAKLFSARARRASRVVADGPDLFDDPALPAAVAGAANGVLEPGRALLAASSTDHELRSARLGRLATAVVPHIAALSSLQRENPDDADLALWLGDAHIQHGWQVRGSAVAKDTERRKFEEFWLILGRAYEPLARAAELRPGDPNPWERLQWYGLGAQRPRQELDDFWAELQRRGPAFFAGHASRLQVLCAKWQGSKEELAAFTRAAAADAPVGSPLPALLVTMHIELATDQEADPNLYFMQNSVREELASAADAWCEKPDGGVRTAEAHHLFGHAFWLGGDILRARRHLSRVSPWSIPKNLPWFRYAENPAALYLHARSEVGVVDGTVFDFDPGPAR